ncbi:hypothetical protein [Demequina iriomotensis]|uniref:hypothetical protein n=1 Tax=Demequina iriomotensis TaxID=1536641 RepID=UPI0007808658|nr:hypothetical protein [Demequina iriomotensis]
MDTTRRLDIPGARGKVEVDGVLGLLYKVRIDGTVVKRTRGAWAVPMRNGSTGRLTANGVIPGFQTLRFQGEPILTMGAHVEPAAKVAMFAPLLLIAFSFVGAMLAVVMFLTNVLLVKNPQVPAPLRIALPVINTAVMAAVLALIGVPSLLF